jgi:hypothetical protein
MLDYCSCHPLQQIPKICSCSFTLDPKDLLPILDGVIVSSKEKQITLMKKCSLLSYKALIPCRKIGLYLDLIFAKINT